MAERQFVLVVYDISNDKRRTKLHNVLLDYGSPVQYSVFECLLEKERIQAMKQAVYRVIKSRVDHVRFYPICKSDLEKVEVTCGKDVLQGDQAAIIVSEDCEQS